MPEPAMKGLPEGVDFVEFRTAAEEDFELVGGEIFRGHRAGAASGVIVKPAEGYTFRADIRKIGTYFAVKKLPNTEIVATVKFVVDNSFDLETVNGRLEKLKDLPGFVEIAGL